MKRNYLIGTIFILITSCTGEISADMFDKSPFITQCFNKNEIQELTKIVSKYDSIFLSHSGSDNLNDAYHTYFDTFVLDSNEHSVNQIIARDKEVFCFYNFSSKSIPIYQELWNYYELIDTINMSTTYSFDLNVNGKFLCILEKLSDQNELIKYYLESVYSWYGTPSSSRFGLIYNHDSFDFNDPIIRLVFIVNHIVIHSDLHIEDW